MGEVDAASVRGWELAFPELPAGTVHTLHEMSRPGGQLAPEAARTTLREMQEEAERNVARESGDPRQLLRFGGVHFEQALQRGREVVQWEWHHRSGWRPYGGLESELLEHRHAAGEDYALLNGAKPTAERPSHPLQVLFNARWAGPAGSAFAFCTQVDLLTRNRRGVRRTVYRPGDRDYLLAHWMARYPRVPSRGALKVYNDYLGAVAAAYGNEGAATAAAAAAEAELSRQAALRMNHVMPPQDEVPAQFVCPITQAIMLTPVFPRDNPRVARCEKSVGRPRARRRRRRRSPAHPARRPQALEEWLRRSGRHPITREALGSVSGRHALLRRAGADAGMRAQRRGSGARRHDGPRHCRLAERFCGLRLGADRRARGRGPATQGATGGAAHLAAERGRAAPLWALRQPREQRGQQPRQLLPNPRQLPQPPLALRRPPPEPALHQPRALNHEPRLLLVAVHPAHPLLERIVIQLRNAGRRHPAHAAPHGGDGLGHDHRGRLGRQLHRHHQPAAAGEARSGHIGGGARRTENAAPPPPPPPHRTAPSTAPGGGVSAGRAGRQSPPPSQTSPPTRGWVRALQRAAAALESRPLPPHR